MSPRANEIADLAGEFAAMDPNARRVVVAGDDDYPEKQIAAAIANVANPGAVVLTRAGKVHAVLDVEEALNGGIIDISFAKARIT